jgi:hypothetical protein
VNAGLMGLYLSEHPRRKDSLLTEVDGAAVDATSGTGAGYIAFLDYAEKKGELPAATVQNWRGASLKALAIEDDWRDMNLVDFDLEAHLGRFETLRRTSYTASSMKAYKSRAKVGIESYRLCWPSLLIGSPRAQVRPGRAGTAHLRSQPARRRRQPTRRRPRLVTFPIAAH